MVSSPTERVLCIVYVLHAYMLIGSAVIVDFLLHMVHTPGE